MAGTGFLRSDELTAATAAGCLPLVGRSQTNVFHLPVVGSGDGGIYSQEPLPEILDQAHKPRSFTLLRRLPERRDECLRERLFGVGLC